MPRLRGWHLMSDVATSRPMVEARHVRKSFGRLEVLKGIDLTVNRGEVLCLIGPSGSGKSTFIRCINHLEKIDGGELVVDGELVGYRQHGNRLYELRDKPLPTHAYITNELTGCLLYMGPSVGYGLPYSTQYTAPTRLVRYTAEGRAQVPQAEPNGLFMPSSAEGTWVMLKSPTEDKVQPVYVEQRVLVAPFRLPALECAPPAPPTPPAPTAKK